MRDRSRQRFDAYANARTESRKLEVRCGLKSKDQSRKVYVHMLNGTLCATERALCCLVENYQTPEVRPDEPEHGELFLTSLAGLTNP